ncbi:MAG: immunoglobulin-like domain-containing protein [Woeseiaceae bacterium]
MVTSALAAMVVSSSAFAQAIPQKNVNVIGPTPVNWLLAGNPRMQQNEPECAVSPGNSNWQFCGFNDYRGVNDPVIGDAFPGVAMSRDGGRTWISGLHPQHLGDIPTINQKFGADANIEALPNFLLYNFIAGWRDDSFPGGVYVSRWYEHNREVGPPWELLDVIEVDVGTSGKFLDKPAFDVALYDPALGRPPIEVSIPAYDDPRNLANSHPAYTLSVPAARAHLCYSVFVGNDNNDGTKITCVASDDGGQTWPVRSKITESVDINQGASVATRNGGQDVLAVWRRFDDNNETSAIMYATSTDFGNSWSKGEVLTEFCAFDQSTGPARFRTNALPVAVSNGTDFSVYFASRNDATETCFIPPKGNGKNKAFTPRMSDVGEGFDFDGAEDGEVRTFLNFSRIMMVRGSGSGSLTWSTPELIDPQTIDGSDNPNTPRKPFHQFMPAAEVAAGIETVSWYDSRMDKLNNLATPIVGGFVQDYVLHLEENQDGSSAGTVLPSGLYDLVPPPPQLPPAINNFPLRRNIDTFAAQLVGGSVRPYTVDDQFYPDTNGSSSNSVRVSRFATRAKPGGAAGERQQLEYNYANGRLFRKGRAPFIGDYNTVFSPQYRKLQSGEWVSNQNPLDLSSTSTELFGSSEPVFNIGWTSNHQVRGRVYYTGCDVWDEALQMWVASPEGCASTYQDPTALNPAALAPLTGEDGSTDGPPGVCQAVSPGQLAPQPLTRNQNIFVASLKPGINVNVVSAIKFPDGVGFNTFVLELQNGTPQSRRVRMELPADDAAVSFSKDSPLTSIEVNIKRGSGNARTVFDVANILDAPDDVIVEVFDVTGLAPEQSQLRGTGTKVARVALVRNSLVPLENVQNNDPDDLRNIIDPADGEFYDIILKREIGVRRSLDLENLDLENLDLENSIFLLDLENLDLENLDLENLDLENLDLENAVLFLDLENLDLENVDLSNLDLENALYEQLDLENLDLENLDLENLDLENLDLENRNLFYLDLENLDLENTVFEQLDLENLDLENLDLENLDLENLDLENLDLENFSIYASDVENLDLENLDLENTAPGDEYVEISWTADSATNTTTGVDIKPLFSPNLAGAIAEEGTKVLLTVRQPYLTGTVATNQAGAAPGVFCTPQVVAENQVVFAAILDASQINDLIADPDPSNPNTPSFVIDPDGSKIITMRFINPPAGFDIESLSRNTGVALYTQPGGGLSCDEELGGAEVFEVCEIDYIADNDPPVITLNGNATVTVDAAPPPSVYLDAGATAFDENDGEIEPVITSNDVDLAALGTYSVTYTATDAAGNSSTATRTVIVADLTPPSITAPANITQEATASMSLVNIGTATASDFIGPVTVSSDAPASFPLGTTVVTWTATDGAGLSNTAPQSVTLVDTTAPTLTLLGDNPLELQATADAYVDAGATAVDAVYGMLLPVITANDVDPTTVGAYSVTYAVTDGSSNTATATRVVSVVDTTDPVIIISDPPDFTPDEPFLLPPGDTTLSISWPVSAQDLESGLSLVCTIDGVDIDPASTSYVDGVLTAVFDYDFAAGTTSVTCTVTDQGGNSSTSDPFDVLVEDIPVITALEGTVVIPTDGGATASVSNSQLAANITVADQVNPDLSDAIVCLADDPTDFAIGEHTIECTVTDSGGNSASTTFQLEVVYPYDVVILPLKGNIKAGSTVPFDWYYVATGTTNPVNSSTVDPTVAWFGAFSDRNCTTGSDGGGDGAEDSGSSSIRYSGSDDTWRLNWQTPSTPGWIKIVVTPPGTDASSECVRLRK